MADINFIESNHAYAEKAKLKLRKQHLPADIETFINLFNQGLINTRNDSVKDIVKLITSGYGNVASQGNKIYVKSEDETVIEQTDFFLKQYKLVATLKRIAGEMLEADYSADTKLIIKAQNPGFIYLEPDVDDMFESDDEDAIEEQSEQSGNSYDNQNHSVLDDIQQANNDEQTAPESTEKVFSEKDLELYTDAERFTSSKTALPSNLFLKALIHDYNPDEQTAYLLLGDLAKQSTSPVEHLKQFVDETKEAMKDANYEFTDNGEQ